MAQKKKQGKKDTRKIEKIMMCVFIGAAALILITAVALVYRRHVENKATQQTEGTGEMVVGTDDYAQSYSYDFSEIGLVKDGFPEINELVEKYLDASLIGDYDTLNSIVRSDTPLDAVSLPAQNGYVEAYTDISCYTMDGLVDDTYVVYVSYNTKILNVDTPAPSLIRLYVCRDKDGSVYINNTTLSGEVEAYMESADNEEDVQILRSDVNKKLKEACASDEKLNGVYQALMNGSPTGGTTAAPETTAAPTTTETETEKETETTEEETETETETEEETEKETETEEEKESETSESKSSESTKASESSKNAESTKASESSASKSE